MKNAITLRGIELRYVLTHYLHHRDYPATIGELADELESRGFAVVGRASKAISDALRWECRYGRVYRRRRGLYGPASMPRSTEYRIHQRVMTLRARAKEQWDSPEGRADPEPNPP
ncbi:hypothetical protein [Mycolicibacter longobardus]|uniref:Uncharacterized protein n=1 Tax=Mycolicibacter longobardus TaxID=1108812 RepID=A0A1X1YHD3_9MYCO|nr:hypothetical protein [Mycolicibacter longobardus]MCV7382366.1 hypothetical protein [Mycolicibacter longobardus]ORW10430.1 hypothetical protein AWC16_13720 [Mycolicibacter longobardus]